MWVKLSNNMVASTVEGFDVYNSVRAVEICSILNVVVPKEFRVPEFIKYTRSYYNKMMEVVHNDKLLIHFFKDNLIGSMLS
jgi:hypothetical protein